MSENRFLEVDTEVRQMRARHHHHHGHHHRHYDHAPGMSGTQSLAFPLSALSGYALIRRWVRWRPAAVPWAR